MMVELKVEERVEVGEEMEKMMGLKEKVVEVGKEKEEVEGVDLAVELRVVPQTLRFCLPLCIRSSVCPENRLTET